MTQNSYDELIDMAVSDAELISGRSMNWIIATGGKVVRPVTSQEKKKAPNWTAEEDRKLREMLPYYSIDEIGRELGRSANAIHVHAVRRGFVSARKAPGYLSTREIADILSVDTHNTPTWVDIGLLEGELYPYANNRMRRVKIVTFKRWLIRPTSWVYFRAERIKNPHLRRLVQLAQQKWGDRWLTTKEAAEICGCGPKDILRQIKLGRLYGYRAIGMGRKRKQHWAYWYLPAKQLEGFEILRGSEHEEKWSEAAEAFLEASRMNGKTYAEIAALMKMKEKAVEYYWRKMRNWREK
jgi:hypothetical protein